MNKNIDIEELTEIKQSLNLDTKYGRLHFGKIGELLTSWILNDQGILVIDYNIFNVYDPDLLASECNIFIDAKKCELIGDNSAYNSYFKVKLNTLKNYLKKIKEYPTEDNYEVFLAIDNSIGNEIDIQFININKIFKLMEKNKIIYKNYFDAISKNEEEETYVLFHSKYTIELTEFVKYCKDKKTKLCLLSLGANKLIKKINIKNLKNEYTLKHTSNYCGKDNTYLEFDNGIIFITELNSAYNRTFDFGEKFSHANCLIFDTKCYNELLDLQEKTNKKVWICYDINIPEYTNKELRFCPLNEINGFFNSFNKSAFYQKHNNGDYFNLYKLDFIKENEFFSNYFKDICNNYNN